jgi:hypothetical protein
MLKISLDLKATLTLTIPAREIALGDFLWIPSISFLPFLKQKPYQVLAREILYDYIVLKLENHAPIILHPATRHWITFNIQ